MSKYYRVEKLRMPNGDDTHTSTRYVRADVALRYARMREYISRRDAWKCGTKDCICNEAGICDCHSYTTYEEAQQAAQRGKDEK